MYRISNIQARVDALSVRLRAIHGGDWLALSYHSGSWWARCHFAGVIVDYADTPEDALDKFERLLERREKADDYTMLARTLGVVAA